MRMGVRYFDDWVEKDHLAKYASLELLKGSVVGVDAAYFAKKFLTEPLLTALGGSPIALEALTGAVQELKDAGVELHFVFNGLSYKKSPDPFSLADWTSKQNAEAFAAYEDETPERARHTFQELVKPNLDEHMDIIKAALYRKGVPFTVAPYSALAQLAYFEQHSSQYIDIVYGPSDVLFFGVERIITDFGLGSENSPERGALVDPDQTQFRWVDTSHCLKALGVGVHPQVFTEALILAGSDLFLSTYPPLAHKAGPMYPPSNVLRDAIQFIMTTRGNISQPLESLTAGERDRWLDEYKQAMTIIKHHVIINADGDVECLDKDRAPVDLHECIGLRLPEELYMYLARGAIGSRVLNSLTRDEVLIPTPLAGAQAPRYQDFVTTELETLRRQPISLLTEGLHRYYQRTAFRKHFWYDRNLDTSFKPIDVNPPPRRLVSGWLVREDALKNVESSARPGTLTFAILALEDVDFAKSTISPRSKSESPLLTQDEILANTTWRFLQLRDFVDESHQLTKWGKVLCAALSANQGTANLEEAIFVAIELLRYDLLSAATLSPDAKGNPQNGSDQDKESCTLISRVASTGKLRHKSIGYSGPLSRALLAYHSFISTLWLSLRDLLEMNMTAGFLEGSFSRNRDDWMELSLRLPFRELSSCSLGIATWTYLDHLEQHGDPTVKATRDQTRTQAQQWIKFSEFESSLDDAFQIWDAVYKGVKTGGKLVQNQKLWDNANTWLASRR